MTAEEFLAYYPPFDGCFPAPVLAAAVEAANARFGDFAEDAEDARRLYIAHRLTLWAKSMAVDTSGSGASRLSALAAAGDGTRISSRKVDDVAITYATGGSGGTASRLADLEESLYGVQLLALLRLHSCSRYVP